MTSRRDVIFFLPSALANQKSENGKVFKGFFLAKQKFTQGRLISGECVSLLYVYHQSIEFTERNSKRNRNRLGECSNYVLVQLGRMRYMKKAVAADLRRAKRKLHVVHQKKKTVYNRLKTSEKKKIIRENKGKGGAEVQKALRAAAAAVEAKSARLDHKARCLSLRFDVLRPIPLTKAFGMSRRREGRLTNTGPAGWWIIEDRWPSANRWVTCWSGASPASLFCVLLAPALARKSFRLETLLSFKAVSRRHFVVVDRLFGTAIYVPLVGGVLGLS